MAFARRTVSRSGSQTNLAKLELQAVRYIIVGIANTAVGLLAIFGFSHFFGFDPISANLLGYCLGLALGFLLNRAWTFADLRDVRHSVHAYLLAVFISYLANLSIVILGTKILELQTLFIQVMGAIVYSTTLFLLCRSHVFRRG